MMTSHDQPGEEPSLNPSLTKTKGIDWNGPAGFWISLTGLIAAFIVGGIYFG